MSSGAGRAGPNRRPRRLRALELQAPGEESRAAGAELEEEVAAARGWRASERVGDSELGSGTAGGSEVRRSLAWRRPPLQSGPGEEGNRPTGEVKLVCGVQQSNQTTDGQCDKSVRKDWASL